MKFQLSCLAGLVALAAPVSAQQNTQCTTTAGVTNCTTTGQPDSGGVDWGAFSRQQQAISEQNQRNMERSFSNLGAAIAADRDQRKVKRIQKEIQDAIARDTAPVPAPPPSEPPVLLACSLGQAGFSVTLYPNAGRADVTSGGVTKMRAANFTQDSVSWISEVASTSISRVDLSATSTFQVPSLKGQQLAGVCALADRKF